METEESAIAKSTGHQQEDEMSAPDAALLRVLKGKKKISKVEAGYAENARGPPCKKCKFNLGDERKCHIVEGRIDNERGISKFFSPKGDGMLPGDIVWSFVKEGGSKLAYEEGYVIEEGAEGFQCRDCKYYLYSHDCLIVRGKFRPEMSCGFIVRIGHGTEI